jgi:hypothetical protein
VSNLAVALCSGGAGLRLDENTPAEKEELAAASPLSRGANRVGESLCGAACLFATAARTRPISMRIKVSCQGSK